MLAHDATDYCWRCRRAPVRVYGIPCAPCRVVLHADYLERRAANGGRLLYLPDNWIPTMNDRAIPQGKASRMCEECARDFEYTPGIGRPPKRCPQCRGVSASTDDEAPAPRAPRADVEKPAKKKRAEKKKARSARKAPRESHQNGKSNGKGSLAKILIDLRAELTQLQEREAHLQDAIDAMKRLDANG